MPTLDDAINSTAPDPLDAAIDGVANDKTRVRESLYGAVKQNPDEVAKAVQLGRTTGLPPAVVSRNLPQVQQRASIDAIDAAIDKNSALAFKLESQDFAGLAHDDVSGLADIERTLNRRSAGKIGGPAFKRQEVLAPSRGPEASVSSVTSGLAKSLPQGVELSRQGIRAQLADLFGFEETGADAILKGRRAQGDVALSTPEFESSTAQGLYSGGSSFMRQLPGLAASILTRSTVPALATAGVTTEAEAYGKYRARGASGGEAFLGAAGEGGVEVLTEMIPMGTLLGAFGKPGASAAREFVKSQVQEQFGEQVATVLQDAIDTAVANPGKTWGQYLAERPDAAYQTALATLVQSGVMGAGHVAARRLAGPEAQAAAAEQDAQALQQLSALSVASKLRTRDPQSFQEFVEAAAPDEQVYLDARTLQQAGVDLQAFAQTSPAVAAQLEEALATGGDLVIPVSEYAARIAGTDLDPVLTPHLRSTEDALSLDEAQRFYQTQAEEFQKAAAKAMEEKQADDAWTASAKAVETQLFDQLKNAGRFTDDVNTAYATLMRDFYVATASRLGLTPEEMFARYPLQVAAERAVGDARMEQGVETPAFEAWFGDSKVVDAQGSPLVVYHGTNQSIKAFDPARIGARDSGFFGSGFYFTPDAEVAADYADTAVEDSGDGEAIAMPLYVSLRNPFVWDMSDENAAVTRAALASVGVKRDSVRGNSASLGNAKERDVFNRMVREQGYDGVIVRDEDGIQEVVAFRPEQIKSAIGNSGTFDPNNPNILAQGGKNGTAANRPGLQAGQDVHATIIGGAPKQGWAGATRIRRTDGRPAAVYRGAGRQLHAGDFDRSALGRASGNPSSGLGVWFTPHREEAGRYGEVEVFNLDIRKPKVIKIEDLPGFDNVEAAHSFRESLRAQGHDGIAVDARHVGGPVHFVAFAPDTVIRPPSAPSLDFTQFFQSGVDQTASPEFKRWFGDSKVVDANGRPLVVYHGTADDIEAFKVGPAKRAGHGKQMPGIYFSPLPSTASSYARTAANAKDASTEINGANIVPAYVAISNPAEFTDPDEFAKANRQKLVQAGHDGAFRRNSQGEIVEIVAFRPEQIKSAIGNSGAFALNSPNILAQPEGQEGNRGEIAFAGDITQTPSVITLFENADLSTLLHEMGHFQLEVLANIASQPDAPAAIADDMAAVLKWFGVPDLATWRGMSLEEKRPHHEAFARGFEAYLFEGKAPSQELSGLFARFRAWLLNVYKSIKALNVQISDDIRGVFDRMLATDDAIKAAEEARAMAPLFTAPEQMADPQRWTEYQREATQATQEAVDALQGRSLRDMRWLDNARGRLLKQMQRDAMDKRKAVETEVKAEVDAMPVYQAQRFLRTGEMTAPDGEQVKVEKGYKLDNAALAEMYPENALARPALEKLRGLTRNEGLHPNLVAEMFGFTSGDHLVRELVDATPRAELIEGLTDQRMLERYGDLNSPDTLARAVDEAIHNEARARFVATELKAITKAVGPVRALQKAAKDFAAATIARKQVKDIKPNQSAAAEARAARAAQKAMVAGDTVAAADEKRKQLVQNYTTRAAYDALDEVDKAVRYLRKFDTEGTRKGLDIDYIEQIDALLDRFDLRASVTNKAAAKRQSLLEWVEGQRVLGFEPEIPAELLAEAQRKPYREMTLEELRGLVDTVKQIEHLGRLKHKLLTAQDQREFEAARDLIVGSIRDNAKKSLPEQRASDRGFLVKMGSLFRYASAIHRKFSSLARGFDGFKDGGPAWEYLVRNMNARGDFEAVQTEQATLALTKLLMPVMDKANGKLTQKEYFPGLGKSFSREERISMLLNMGNETNLERLLTGERIAPAQLQQIVGTLTKADAEFANRVWEYLDTFRPMIAEKERRVTGKEPEWVQAQPFTLTLADGEKVQMRGGYYPIAYDPLRSERSNADLNAEVARQVQQGLYARAQTRRGHTKARSESTGRPLRYDFGEVIANHVTQVIHDLAWHEYLIDANRLLRSPAIEQAVREHYGVEVLQEMKDTLRDVAVGSLGAEKGATFWNHLRYGTTIAGLGFNVFNTLQNLTGITQSMSRLGSKWVFKGAAHWAGDAARFESSIAKVHEKSDFMRLRAKTMQREINDIRNKVAGKDSKLTAAYFYLQAKTQLVVDIPTWWGAYEKAMAQDDMTEAKAIALADQAVIDAQGSGQTKDLAGIQRGGAGMKLFTTFYSFFNTTFNLTAEAYQRTDFTKPKDVALFAADVALLYSIPALLTTLLKAALAGDWDDEDKLAKKIVGDQISFAMGTVIGLREASSAIQAAAGVGEGFGYTGPASVRFFSDLYNLGKQIQQGEADEAFWKALNNTGGVLFHYPAGQVNRTVSGVVALSEGRTENPMAVVMGAPPKK